jgi:diguanylate cyclase (GGDEF)-like protein/PAS domain S-box-containing protein
MAFTWTGPEMPETLRVARAGTGRRSTPHRRRIVETVLAGGGIAILLVLLAEQLFWPGFASGAVEFSLHALAFSAMAALALRMGARNRAARNDANALAGRLAQSEADFGALAECSPLGAWLTDRDGLCVYLNPALCELSGLLPQQALGTGWARCIHPEDRVRVLDDLNAAARARQKYRGECRILSDEGKVTWVRAFAAPIFEGGNFTGYAGMTEDITGERTACNELLARERRLQMIADNAPGLVAYVDRTLRYRFVSKSYEEWLGRPVAEITSRPIEELLPPEVIDWMRPHLDQALLGRRNTFLRQVREVDGKPCHEQTTLVPDRRPDGEIEGIYIFNFDLTPRIAAERGLRREKERALVTLESIADAVITVDAAGRVDYMNPVAQELAGWSDEEARGRDVTEVFLLGNESTHEAVENPVAQCLRIAEPVSLVGDALLCRQDGEFRSIDLSVAPICVGEGEPTGAVLVFRDVGSSRRMSRQLTWQAQHDALTGLANRRKFERSVEGAIDSARGEGKRHVAIFLDLDQFKIVNDTCGHEAGDALLRDVSAMLGRQVRAKDTLARLGGDEFGLLLRNCEVKEGEELAERLRASIQDFRFAWSGKTFAIGGSFGVVAIDATAENFAEVMRNADSACYCAKELGRNRVHVHIAGDYEVERRRDQMEWVGRIRSALDESRFVLYAQPIVPLSGGAPEHHVEVLVRMVDEDGAIVPPMAFIPAAERYGLMPMVDRWVVTNALAEARARLAAGITPKLAYAINLSGASIGDDGFLEFVREELRRTPDVTASVIFEITETAAVANLSRAQDFMAELRQTGVRFALDDFGSGMSSFAYLKALPVDFLKIDGSFVRRIADDPVDFAMVKAIHSLGHAMGLRTIAEFVENERVLEKLRAVGVDFGQGNQIGLPQPLCPQVREAVAA